MNALKSLASHLFVALAVIMLLLPLLLAAASNAEDLPDDAYQVALIPCPKWGWQESAGAESYQVCMTDGRGAPLCSTQVPNSHICIPDYGEWEGWVVAVAPDGTTINESRRRKIYRDDPMDLGNTGRPMIGIADAGAWLQAFRDGDLLVDMTHDGRLSLADFGPFNTRHFGNCISPSRTLLVECSTGSSGFTIPIP